MSEDKLLYVRKKVIELLNLPENWDSCGAAKIAPHKARQAIVFYETLVNEMPSIIPTRGGGIQFEWHVNGVDIEIDINDKNEYGDGFISFQEV